MAELLTLFFAHFVADFLFQTNNMAMNKAYSLKWLSIHVGTYTLTIAVFSFFLFEPMEAIQFAAINGALHYITDFFTSKLTSKLSKWQNQKWFYTAIGFDQFIHAACLIVTCAYFT